MKYFLLTLLFILGCKHNEIKDAELPSDIVIDLPTVESIREVALTSACAKISWKNRGVTKPGYFSGMALTYARAVCHPEFNYVKEISKQNQGSSDALYYYGLSDSDQLLKTYTFLIGLGMRESTGKFCEGRDKGAANTSSDTAEAGLFQTSFNTQSKSKVLVDLYKDQKMNPKNCFIDDFSRGFTCYDYNLKNWGNGEGVTFQHMEKSCPSFAADYAAVTIRVARSHYGPINRFEVEYRPECESMLSNIKKMIEARADLCLEL